MKKQTEQVPRKQASAVEVITIESLSSRSSSPFHPEPSDSSNDARVVENNASKKRAADGLLKRALEFNLAAHLAGNISIFKINKIKLKPI